MGAGSLLHGKRTSWWAALQTAFAQLQADQRELVQDAFAAADRDGRTAQLITYIKNMSAEQLGNAVSVGVDQFYEEAGADDDDGVAEAFDAAAGLGRGGEVEKAAAQAERQRLLRHRERGKQLKKGSATKRKNSAAAQMWKALFALGRNWARVRAAYRNSAERWNEEATHSRVVPRRRGIPLAKTVEGRALLKGKIPTGWKGEITVARHPAWPPWPKAELVPDKPCQEEHEYSHCPGCRLWIPPSAATCPLCSTKLPPAQGLRVPHRHCDTCGIAEEEERSHFVKAVAKVKIATFERTHLGWACGSDHRGCRSSVLNKG